MFVLVKILFPVIEFLIPTLFLIVAHASVWCLTGMPLLSWQGSCLQSEEHLSLQINLSTCGDRPADLDKLKPYVIEHILVLLVAPTAGQAAVGGFV